MMYPLDPAQYAAHLTLYFANRETAFTAIAGYALVFSLCLYALRNSKWLRAGLLAYHLAVILFTFTIKL